MDDRKREKGSTNHGQELRCKSQSARLRQDKGIFFVAKRKKKKRKGRIVRGGVLRLSNLFLVSSIRGLVVVGARGGFKMAVR